MNIRTSHLPYDLIEVTKKAVEFYVNKYFDKKTAKRLDEILIAFRKINCSDTLAATGVDDEYIGVRKLPREFIIEFNNSNRDIPIREYLITLFHEMTHVKQYAEGRLKQMHNDEVHLIWEGVAQNTETMTYWDQPWEREALSIELGAYALFSDAHPEYGLDRWMPTWSGRAESGWKNPVKSAT